MDVLLKYKPAKCFALRTFALVPALLDQRSSLGDCVPRCNQGGPDQVFAHGTSVACQSVNQEHIHLGSRLSGAHIARLGRVASRKLQHVVTSTIDMGTKALSVRELKCMDLPSTSPCVSSLNRRLCRVMQACRRAVIALHMACCHLSHL